jgi:cytidine deaminase
MQIVDINTILEVYSQPDELVDADRQLLQEAQQATNSAYAPYSHFCVGAALLLEDGSVIRGSNQENAAYPSGLCAERTAIFWAGANHPGKTIRSIAVTARHANQPGHFLGASSCGACRQSMLEYENRQSQPIRLIMQGDNDQIWVSPSIANLLPLQFNAENLKSVNSNQ